MIKKQDRKNSFEIAESNIKNLLKKPANGGMPAIEKMISEKVIATV
jgi:hypothetical protein